MLVSSLLRPAGAAKVFGDVTAAGCGTADVGVGDGIRRGKAVGDGVTVRARRVGVPVRGISVAVDVAVGGSAVAVSVAGTAVEVGTTVGDGVGVSVSITAIM